MVTHNSAVTTAIRCTLAAQSDSDVATVRLAPSMSTTVNMQLAHTYTGLGDLEIVNAG